MLNTNIMSNSFKYVFICNKAYEFNQKLQYQSHY